jgi:hypothetical protein
MKQRYDPYGNLKVWNNDQHHGPTLLSGVKGNPCQGGAAAASAITTKVVLDTFEKSGIFDFTKSGLSSLSKKIDSALNDPIHNKLKKDILKLPKLELDLQKKKNALAIKGPGWQEFRKVNHQLQIANIEAKIEAILRSIERITVMDGGILRKPRKKKAVVMY